MILKSGSSGAAVRTVQEMLNYLGVRVPGSEGEIDAYVSIQEDGIFGEETEAAVLDFQEQYSLLADGIVGPNTFHALERAFLMVKASNHSPGADSFDNMADPSADPRVAGNSSMGTGNPVRLTFECVRADPYKEGYDRLWLRSDVAAAYQKVYDEVRRRGGKLTTSGGRRELNVGAGPNRSAISFHYTGRALDLFIYSGMVNPAKDLRGGQGGRPVPSRLRALRCSGRGENASGRRRHVHDAARLAQRRWSLLRSDANTGKQRLQAHTRSAVV
jgi:hypothetical protein